MTRFEEFKNMDIDDLSKWIDKHGQFDDSPWMTWWDENYCSKCEPIVCHYPDSAHEFSCAWCELNDYKCRFFPEMDKQPDSKDIVKMWLESEYNTK